MSFNKVSITFITKPGKNSTRKGNYRLNSLINIDAKSPQNVSKPNLGERESLGI